MCRNEGFNSRLNRLVAVKHPKPNVLIAKIVDELTIGEAEVERLDVRIYFVLCRENDSRNTYMSVRLSVHYQYQTVKSDIYQSIFHNF